MSELSQPSGSTMTAMPSRSLTGSGAEPTPKGFGLLVGVALLVILTTLLLGAYTVAEHRKLQMQAFASGEQSLIERTSGDIAAVGEIHFDATQPPTGRFGVEAAVWGVTLLPSAGLVGLLALTWRQQRVIQAQGRIAQIQAAENADLREQAGRARLEASRANERALHELGEALHDGPVQLLGLMALGNGSGGSRPAAMGDLAGRALAELRAIASGLVLPDVRGLSLADALRIVVERHEGLTGSQVALEIGRLPAALGEPQVTCLYRVAQEGLMNAFRHGNGDQRLSASLDGEEIALRVSNATAPGRAPTMPGQRDGLGLRGIERRLALLGGTLEFDTGSDGCATLTVRLPIGPDGAAASGARPYAT